MAMTPDDEFLLERIRAIVKRRKGFSEQKMFGGICVMLNGNMCVGTWKGSLVVRLERNDHDAIQREPHTAPMDITGKAMIGWALVEPDGITDDEDLRSWVERAAKYVATLPKKKP